MFVWLDLTSLPGTNTLAYYENSQIICVKVLQQGTGVIWRLI